MRVCVCTGFKLRQPSHEGQSRFKNTLCSAVDLDQGWVWVYRVKVGRNHMLQVGACPTCPSTLLMSESQHIFEWLLVFRNE